MQISENLFTGEISKAVTETKTNKRNSLVNQGEVKYELFDTFIKIRHFRSFLEGGNTSLYYFKQIEKRYFMLDSHTSKTKIHFLERTQLLCV